MKTALLGFGLRTGIALAMLALAAVPIGVAAGAPDKSSPTGQFLMAYNSMSQADLMAEKGLRSEAADLYTEALNLFLKISTDEPQWQPAVIAFRISYCRAALKRLEGSAERKALSGARAAPMDLPAPERSPLRKDALAGPVAGQAAGGEKPVGTNQQSAIRDFSPMNLKLQQAALKERGRDYTGALAMYIALLEEYPQEPWALKGACRCCLRLGYMDKARALTRQALTLPLPDAGLNLLAALVDCHDGRYQDAIPRLRQSLKQNFACPEAHAALGVALAATGAMQEAQEEMKRALSFNPKLGDAYYNLARLSLRQKPTDYDTARVHYQNALRHGAAPDPELDTLLAE